MREYIYLPTKQGIAASNPVLDDPSQALIAIPRMQIHPSFHPRFRAVSTQVQGNQMCPRTWTRCDGSISRVTIWKDQNRISSL